MRTLNKRNMIMDEMRNRLKTGSYGSSFLPPETKLAEELGVSRNLIRTVIQELENEKFLTHIPGRGSLPIQEKSASGKKIYFLLACPDYFLRFRLHASGYFHRQLLNGVFQMTSKYNLQAIMLPISNDNNPRHLNKEQLYGLEEGSGVIVPSRWFAPVFPILRQRNCKISFIYSERNLIDELTPYMENNYSLNLDVFGGVKNAISWMSARGKKRTALMEWDMYGKLNPVLPAFLEAIFEAGQKVNHDLLLEHPHTDNYRKLLSDFYAAQKFDSIFTGASSILFKHDSPTYNSAFNMPEDVDVVLKGRVYNDPFHEKLPPSLWYDLPKIGCDAVRLIAENASPCRIIYPGEVRESEYSNQNSNEFIHEMFI